MKNSGIYRWTSPSGKSYIGKAINLKKRRKEFQRPNSPYTGWGSAIDNARKKYKDFTKWHYEVLAYASLDELNRLEVHYIERFNTYENGYNSTRGGDGCNGIIHSEETKAKIRKSKKARGYTEAQKAWGTSERNRENCRQRWTGRIWTSEQREKISNSLKGHKLTPEQREKRDNAIRARFASGWVNEKQIATISKKVDQFTLSGEYLQTFPSIIKAAQAMNRKDGKQIRKCCQGKKQNIYGYIWKFHE
jgi:group I intron endonuclease